MLSYVLPAPILGAFSLFLHTINTFFWFIPIIIGSLFKLLLPLQKVTDLLNSFLNLCATGWISVNNVIISITKKIHWQVELPDGLKRDNWYLVISNHQSWIDILVLQKIFNRKIPFLKFFLKQELIWVPVLGLAWWALDFPFMKRYKPSYLKKHPEKKGKDFETTQKACEKFRRIPISVMNFVEGTRFTEEKHQKQNSPYQRLLKPKSGGISYVLAAMGHQFQHILDVTIRYPDGVGSFWDFLCGRVKRIEVIVTEKPVEADLLSVEGLTDSQKQATRKWINQCWEEKDKVLSE